MRVTSHTHLAIATLILAFAFTCYGASVFGPNKPSAEKASPREVNAHTQNDSDAIRAAKAELQAEMYKDSADSLKWALGIIIGLVIIFVGYAVFKDTREYRQSVADAKQALSQAREASKEARNASDKARDYEEKAQQRLTSIDRKVSAKLKEIEGRSTEKLEYIEERGKAQIEQLLKEAEKQRKVSRETAEEQLSKQLRVAELFGKYQRALQDKNFVVAADYCEQALKIGPRNVEVLNNWGISLMELSRTKPKVEVDELVVRACKIFEDTIAIQPDYFHAWNNWGIALEERAKLKSGDEADKLFKQAYEKYNKAVGVKPDYYEAWSNWGGALLYNARKKRGEEQEKLWGETKDKCLRAESIKTGAGAYNLACAHVLLGEEKECQKRLKSGEQAGTLPTREHAMGDDDLKGVRDKAWFKKLRWKGE